MRILLGIGLVLALQSCIHKGPTALSSFDDPCSDLFDREKICPPTLAKSPKGVKVRSR